jgi:hypothetical protein
LKVSCLSLGDRGKGARRRHQRARPADRADVARSRQPSYRCRSGRQLRVRRAQGNALSENAREFAWLTMAVCDGLIASMKMKYPASGTLRLRFAKAKPTGTPRTVPDGGWESFVFAPPYPSYPGNQATAAGAARAVLEHVYGRDGHVITLTSQLVPDVVLHYTSWEQITSTTPASMAEFTTGSTRTRVRAWDGRSAGTFSRTCSVLCLGDRLHGPWRREGQGDHQPREGSELDERTIPRLPRTSRQWWRLTKGGRAVTCDIWTHPVPIFVVREPQRAG